MTEATGIPLAQPNWGALRDLLKRRGAKAFISKLVSHGPLGLATAAFSVASDYCNMRAASAQEQAASAQQQAAVAEAQLYQSLESRIPQYMKFIEASSVRVPETAFNASSEYVEAFQCAMLLSISLSITRGVLALENTAVALQGIREELTIQTGAQVNGWTTEGFGHHAYGTVAGVMEQYPDRNSKHRFYLCVPGSTGWKTKFNQESRLSPFDERFGGHHHDLALLCTRMWTDRQTLLDTTSDGAAVQFHMILLSFERVVIADPVIIHESLGPMQIHGELYRDSPCIWLNLVQLGSDLKVEHVGVLKGSTEKISELEESVYMAFARCAGGFALASVAAMAFPPLMVYAAAGFAGSMGGSLATSMVAEGARVYCGFIEKPPLVLGPPTIPLGDV